MTTKVLVVAWEFETGGGFDWYYPGTDISEAIAQERANCLDLADEGWQCCNFEFEVTDFDSATDEIDAYIWGGDFAALPNYYKHRFEVGDPENHNTWALV